MLSKQEIEEYKRTSNNTELLIQAFAYLGDKKQLDDIPHLYVLFHPQSKIAERGFAYNSKAILSNKFRDPIEKEMNEKFPKWSFEMNDNEYNIDTAKRMIMFSSSTIYNDRDTSVVTYCYFLMETGVAQIIFSFNKSIIRKYADVMKKILGSVQIEPGYKLVKD